MFPSLCPSGYGKNGDVCVSSSCAKGYTWVDGSCMTFPTLPPPPPPSYTPPPPSVPWSATSLQCAPFYNYNNSKMNCSSFSSLSKVYGDIYAPSIPVLAKCNTGMNINGSCYNCSMGYVYHPSIGCTYIGGTASNMSPFYVGKTLQQQALNDYYQNSSNIYKNASYSPFPFQATCSSGYTLEGTICSDKTNKFPSLCPSGYGKNGDVCVSSSCAKGYTWVDGSCMTFPTLPPPSSYTPPPPPPPPSYTPPPPPSSNTPPPPPPPSNTPPPSSNTPPPPPPPSYTPPPSSNTPPPPPPSSNTPPPPPPPSYTPPPQSSYTPPPPPSSDTPPPPPPPSNTPPPPPPSSNTPPPPPSSYTPPPPPPPSYTPPPPSEQWSTTSLQCAPLYTFDSKMNCSSSSFLSKVYGDIYTPSIPVLAQCNVGMNINGSCYNCSQGYVYHPSIGCTYVGGTASNMSPFYIGKTLQQQALNDYYQNSSNIYKNASYSPFAFEATCSSGYTLDGTICSDKTNQFPSVCPSGYGRNGNGNICVPSSCAKGYTWVDGSCLIFPTLLLPPPVQEQPAAGQLTTDQQKKIDDMLNMFDSKSLGPPSYLDKTMNEINSKEEDKKNDINNASVDTPPPPNVEQTPPPDTEQLPPQPQNTPSPPPAPKVTQTNVMTEFCNII